MAFILPLIAGAVAGLGIGGGKLFESSAPLIEIGTSKKTLTTTTTTQINKPTLNLFAPIISNITGSPNAELGVSASTTATIPSTQTSIPTIIPVTSGGVSAGASDGATAGGGIGSLILIGALVGGGIFLLRKKKK